MKPDNAVLCIDSVTIRFGGVVALHDVSTVVQRGMIHAIIGPNGAGKSTLLNIITGIYSPTEGSIEFNGQRIDGMAAHQISRLGICRTFQNTELFGDMSVLENVLVAMHHPNPYGLVSASLHSRRFAQIEQGMKDGAFELLEIVGLQDMSAVKARTLPFGMMRKLEIARALATAPSLLLLDEPAAGLRGIEIEELNEILLKIRSKNNMTILLIDHVMSLVMAVSEKITVLNFGQKIAEGVPQDIRRSPEVIKAYLGERVANALA